MLKMFYFIFLDRFLSNRMTRLNDYIKFFIFLFRLIQVVDRLAMNSVEKLNYLSLFILGNFINLRLDLKK